MLASATMMSTMTVVIAVSRRVGHVTLAVSARTCWMNSKGPVLAIQQPFGASIPRARPGPAGSRFSFHLVCRTTFKSPSAVAPAIERCSSRLPLAGVEGLEPPTPGFGDRCSSQLSYTPRVRRRPDATVPDNASRRCVQEEMRKEAAQAASPCRLSHSPLPRHAPA
jgi:hypothetical protein